MTEPLPTPVVNQPVQKPPFVQKSFPILPVLGLLIIVLLGGIVYLGYQNYQLQQQIKVLTSQKMVPPINETQNTPYPTMAISPTVTPQVDETLNWKIYNNTTFNVSLKYPSDWVVKGQAPNYYNFLPKDFTMPQSIEAQIPGTAFRILHFSYDETIQRLKSAFDRDVHEEPLTVKNLTGVHIWGTIGTGQAQGLSGGSFVLKNTDGNAFELSYEVIKERSYENEARKMIQTLTVTK